MTTTPFGDFGAPPDVAAWAALVLALVIVGVVMSGARVPLARSQNTVLAALAVLAALSSWAYVVFYLRGGPRIIDATTYFLQARALAEGKISFHVLSPSGSFRGRFLLADPSGGTVTGIFPPGYPAVLALGFLAHAPMLVGPVIAALLVVATAALAKRCFFDASVTLLAAALSAVCAVLRYHTADTMSHGWSALLATLTVWSALGERRSTAYFAGAFSGFLILTRPVSGVALLIVAVIGVARAPRRIGFVALGALLPVALLVAQQRVATGAWLGSSQLAYYKVADGPEGCFRYGFGAGVGCVFEHGDFVRAHLARGYGALAAVGTTVRRLKMHLADAGNTELFAPLLVVALGSAFRERASRVVALGVLAIVALYVPFYFDGNYPGGGARFYADVLPLEHVLLAATLVRFHLARFALPLALTGFALHTAYDHERLSRREGGRPMFERERVLAAVHRGLVFVDTDHGFDIGFDAAATDAKQSIVVARRRNDAHDRLLWERLGRPAAYAYDYSPSAPFAEPRLEALDVESLSPSHFEAEAEWPPLEVDSGFVEPVFPACASQRRALLVQASAGKVVHVRLGISAPRRGRYQIRTSWVLGVAGTVTATVAVGAATAQVVLVGSQASCASAGGPIADLGDREEYLEISTTSSVILDSMDVVPAN